MNACLKKVTKSCLDNYFTGSKRNIEHLMDHHYFELVCHNVINPYMIEVDEIYNLACPCLSSTLPIQSNKDHKSITNGSHKYVGLG